MVTWYFSTSWLLRVEITRSAPPGLRAPMTKAIFFLFVFRTLTKLVFRLLSLMEEDGFYKQQSLFLNSKGTS